MIEKTLKTCGYCGSNVVHLKKHLLTKNCKKFQEEENDYYNNSFIDDDNQEDMFINNYPLNKLIHKYLNSHQYLPRHYILRHLHDNRFIITSKNRKHAFIISFSDEEEEFECHLNTNLDKGSDQNCYNLSSFKPTTKVPKQLKNIIYCTRTIEHYLNKTENNNIDKYVIQELLAYIHGF